MLYRNILTILLFMSSSSFSTVNFDHSFEEKLFEKTLYPIDRPREDGYLKVSDLHSIYYAAYGNPEGIPVVVLHGGPGGGCSDAMVESFDLSKWNVVMFDQRGAMRSKPFGCMEENTPQHLVSDIEDLRSHLGIEKWLVFGGSWGSVLALLYGQEHPNRCLGFILRGIWLVRQSDYLHLFYGMGKTFPEAYQEMVSFIPEAERDDLLSAFHRRVFDPDPAVQLSAAKAFMKFDAICASQMPSPKFIEAMLKNDQLVVGVMRAFCHYAKHSFFLEENHILPNMHKIAHLPAILVQGRYDTICPPHMAFSLYQNWPASTLWMIPNGGHTAAEPSMAKALAAATDLFAEKILHIDHDLIDDEMITDSCTPSK